MPLTVAEPLTIRTASDWQDQAACRHFDPNLFFPVGSTGPAVDQIAQAVAICGTCPVQDTCLQYALESNQESGVWGGMAEDDRRQLRRQMLAARRRR